MPITSEEAAINGTTLSSSSGAQSTGSVGMQQKGVVEPAGARSDVQACVDRLRGCDDYEE